MPNRIDLKKCREEIASSLRDSGYRWCKREHVESDSLKEWKANIFKVIDKRINFYSHYLTFYRLKAKNRTIIANRC